VSFRGAFLDHHRPHALGVFGREDERVGATQRVTNQNHRLGGLQVVEQRADVAHERTE
jgi:hypothetical protein